MSYYRFRWIEWNVGHIAAHGVTPFEVERVVNGARPPYPEYQGDERWLVIGRGLGGRFIQVVYLTDEDDEMLFVIHARPIGDREKRRYRRRTR